MDTSADPERTTKDRSDHSKDRWRNDAPLGPTGSGEAWERRGPSSAVACLQTSTVEVELKGKRHVARANNRFATRHGPFEPRLFFNMSVPRKAEHAMPRHTSKPRQVDPSHVELGRTTPNSGPNSKHVAVPSDAEPCQIMPRQGKPTVCLTNARPAKVTAIAIVIVIASLSANANSNSKVVGTAQAPATDLGS